MKVCQKIALQVLAGAFGLLALLATSQAGSLVTSMTPGLPDHVATTAGGPQVLNIAEKRRRTDGLKRRRPERTRKSPPDFLKQQRTQRRKRRPDSETLRKQRRQTDRPRRRLRTDRRRTDRKTRQRRRRPPIQFDIYPRYRDPGYFGPYYDWPYYRDPYYDGPYYDGPRYGYRLTCDRARRIIIERGYRRVRARDCRGRVYRFRARYKGRRYEIRISAYTGAILSVRRY